MKTTTTILLLFAMQFTFAQSFYYNSSPDFETGKNKVATGLAIADINGDGFKDIIAANGNDIERQAIEVFYNDGEGNFNIEADWSSDDIDYHGHCTAADFNNDGWADLAVSVFLGACGFGSPGKLKVYYNKNGELEKNPSFQSEPFYSFSNNVGDANGDGWLDIAVACGDSYHDILDQGRIFINQNGKFDSVANWKSEYEMGAMDVEFGDFDRNGYLDVVFGCDQNYAPVFMSEENGKITKSPSWTIEDNINANSVDVGFVNGDDYPDWLFSNNNQLGGTGKSMLYSPQTEQVSSTLNTWKTSTLNYSSGVLLHDVNNDSYLDFILGGWWQPLRFYMGNGDSFEDSPAFTTSRTSVVEAIVACDLDKSDTRDTVLYIPFSGKVKQNLLYLGKNLKIENVTDVYHMHTDNIWQFSYIPGENWLVLHASITNGDTMVVNCQYSIKNDLVVTNWDKTKGNYIYYYQEPSIVKDRNINAAVKLYPNPVSKTLHIDTKHKIERVQVIDLTGKVLIGILNNDNQRQIDVSGLKEGIYILEISNNVLKQRIKFIKK
jgi:hypothetical protein